MSDLEAPGRLTAPAHSPCLRWCIRYHGNERLNGANKLTALEDIKASGNWMWAAKLPGECTKMWKACVALRQVRRKAPECILLVRVVSRRVGESVGGVNETIMGGGLNLAANELWTGFYKIFSHGNRITVVLEAISSGSGLTFLLSHMER